MPENFFEESSDQSQVKQTIVSKYFWAWAKVITPSARKASNKIAYIDLFAGPGRYENGSKSTPILILEQAVKCPDMQEMLVTIFNDKDPDHTQSLEKSISEITGIENLKHSPSIKNYEIGEHIVRSIEEVSLVPTLFFVDPWGYKGLSLRLINSVLKDWGCDCIFFFNYNRINMGLTNPMIKEHMDALFGEERANNLREQLQPLTSKDRELKILEELINALQDMGGKYVLPFTFKNDEGSRTSHHLIFVSKGFKGYEIMKEIMAKESSIADQGVPSFEYNPADERFPRLFELTTPLDQLESEVLSAFSGQTLTMKEIYEKHSIGRPFLSRNYKDCLRNLEEAGKIVGEPPYGKRRKRKGLVSVADHVTFIFP